MRSSLLLVSLAIGACAGKTPSPQVPPAAPSFSLAPAGSDDAAPSSRPDLAAFIRAHYGKREVTIPMRDGAKLFTAIYAPKKSTGPVPIMLLRTPYSCSPYGEDKVRDKLGPSETLARKGWIFVYQDVRGRFMSEGEFVNMTPHRADKRGDKVVDESSDTFDTIEWLLANVDGHNGRVGQWGISYPGFYAAAGMIDAHPALKAVSPQAPIADWWFDDFHHHGAFFLPHAFNFFSSFGRARSDLTTEWPERFDHGTPDGYRFFLDLGPLSNANERYFKREIAFWNDIVEHPNYDAFWQERNLLPHLEKVAPAVMTVGGLFDAEDLYGTFHIYEAVESKNPKIHNTLVVGPWRHGGWGRDDGQRLGDVDFGAQTALYYQREVEAPFFEHFLAEGPAPQLPEALIFETGRNRWRRFEAWPPPDAKTKMLYPRAAGLLSSDAPKQRRAFDEWISDPNNPVPFTKAVAKGMTREYMVDDQRFAAQRTDVVEYATAPLEEPITLAGPVTAHLWVSTSGTASDFVVKVIDVFPRGAKMPGADGGEDVDFGDYQMMVRSEVIRARFRDGYTEPKPMRSGVPTAIDLELQSVLHTFEKGHRVMIHVQSTWFPMVDINPHRYVDNVFEAEPGDFVPARQRLWRSGKHPTHLEVGVVPTI